MISTLICIDIPVHIILHTKFQHTVFIDLDNIGSCNNPDQVARMLYVAISRARNRIFLFGKLPAKYGG